MTVISTMILINLLSLIRKELVSSAEKLTEFLINVFNPEVNNATLHYRLNGDFVVNRNS